MVDHLTERGVRMKLFVQALAKFLLGVVLVAALIFLPAGAVGFWQGWLLMGVLFIPMLAAGFVMLWRAPALLQKRLRAKETRGEQGLVVKLSGLMFLVGFVVAGLGVRFGWYTLPPAVSIAAAVVFLVAYLLYAEVMRENAYLSRTIEVQEGQRVIDTGLYGIVRHPMYSVTVLLFWMIPLILGSAFACTVFVWYPLLLVRRICDEEALLQEELAGYRDYQKKVKYRLIPFVW